MVDSGVSIFFLSKQTKQWYRFTMFSIEIIRHEVIRGVVIQGVVRMADTSQSSQGVSRVCPGLGWSHPLTRSVKEIILLVTKAEK